jgi:hypothetical protein
MRDNYEQSMYDYAKANFNFDEVFEFCAENRVELSLIPDNQIGCYINYGLDGKNLGAWAIDIHPLLALINGIKTYKERNGEQ